MPTPVALAVHGVWAEPVYATLVGSQVTTTVDPAFVMANELEPFEPKWLASPPQLALALTVPTFVLSRP